MGLLQRFQGSIKVAKLYLGQAGIVDSVTGVAFARVFTNAGAPVSGGSGTLATFTNPGDLLVDTVGLKTYQNTNTKASPTWTLFESSGGAIAFSSADGITAHSGGTKALAIALAANINRVTVVAADNDSALLPPVGAGGFAVITNTGTHILGLYGAGTDTINGIATANQYSLGPNQTAVFYAPVAGAWQSMSSDGAVTISTPANPTAPASTTTFFMQGLAGAITPKRSGNLLVTITGNLIGSSTTAGDGILLQGSYGTGAAPANAAALTGTQAGGILDYTNPTTVTAADINVPFTVCFVVKAAALGTALWLDLAAKCVNSASHVGLANLTVNAVEL